MQNQIEIFQGVNNEINVEVKFEADTVWLSQRQMSELFAKDSDTIGLHIKNIYTEGELERIATTEDYSVVQKWIFNSSLASSPISTNRCKFDKRISLISFSIFEI